MKKALIYCMLGVLSLTSAFAHNPLSAMYYFEVNDDLGILNISLSQAGFQEALIKHYPKMQLDKIADVEYKKLAVEYVKDNFHLKINGNLITLLKGGIKLGSHQTDLKFTTSKLPKNFNTLDVQINAFKENKHHQTIFSLSQQGKTDKVILTENNNYSAAVVFKGHKMIAKNKKFNTNYLWIAAVVPIFLVVRKVLPLGKTS